MYTHMPLQSLSHTLHHTTDRFLAAINLTKYSYVHYCCTKWFAWPFVHLTVKSILDYSFLNFRMEFLYAIAAAQTIGCKIMPAVIFYGILSTFAYTLAIRNILSL